MKGTTCSARERGARPLQGRFKEQIAFDDLMTGQQFSRPFRQLPAQWLLQGLISAARALSPSLVIGDLDAPSLLAPVVATASCINVSLPHQAPSLAAEPVEDMRLVAGVTGASIAALSVPHLTSQLPWLGVSISVNARCRACPLMDGERTYVRPCVPPLAWLGVSSSLIIPCRGGPLRSKEEVHPYFLPWGYPRPKS